MGFGTNQPRPVSAIFRRHTGRHVTHRIAHRDFEAVRATAERDGTETHALLVAQDQRAALRVYAQTTFEEVPALKRDLTTSLTSLPHLEERRGAQRLPVSLHRGAWGALPPSAPMPSRSPASIEP